LGQRSRPAVAQDVGIPTKPIVAAAVEAPVKPASPPGKTSRKATAARIESSPPRTRQAQFTILKARKVANRPSAPSKSEVRSDLRQESPPAGEHPLADKPSSRRGVRRKRPAGVTIVGWLAMTAFAVAAAAIALFSPSWF
jgi:hypothetical protein